MESTGNTGRKLKGLIVLLLFFVVVAALDAFQGLPPETVSNLTLYAFLGFGTFAGANYGEHRERAKELDKWALPNGSSKEEGS